MHILINFIYLCLLCNISYWFWFCNINFLFSIFKPSYLYFIWHILGWGHTFKIHSPKQKRAANLSSMWKYKTSSIVWCQSICVWFELIHRHIMSKQTTTLTKIHELYVSCNICIFKITQVIAMLKHLTFELLGNQNSTQLKQYKRNNRNH